MKTRSKHALSAFAAVTTLLTGIVATPATGFAEEPNTLAAAYDRMDSTIESLEKQAAEIEDQIADVEAEIASLRAEIAELDALVAQDQAALEKLIHDAYVTGDYSSWEALVANGSLSDLLRQQHQDDVLSEKLEEILTRINAYREEKTDKLSELEKKREGLVGLKESVDKALADKKAEEQRKAALREMTLDREELYQKVLEQEENEVVDTITAPSGGSGYTGGGADGLMGSIGYAKAGGNCVNEPGVNRAGGNPETWPVSTQTPTIGATALWHYNHTGVVTGIWKDGSIEVRHQNFSNAGSGWNKSRFSRGAFRGFR